MRPPRVVDMKSSENEKAETVTQLLSRSGHFLQLGVSPPIEGGRKNG
jgi:hypothetical protein